MCGRGQMGWKDLDHPAGVGDRLHPCGSFYVLELCWNHMGHPQKPPLGATCSVSADRTDLMAEVRVETGSRGGGPLTTEPTPAAVRDLRTGYQQSRQGTQRGRRDPYTFDQDATEFGPDLLITVWTKL